MLSHEDIMLSEINQRKISIIYHLYVESKKIWICENRVEWWLPVEWSLPKQAGGGETERFKSTNLELVGKNILEI